jgi:hypothetical protein
MHKRLLLITGVIILLLAAGWSCNNAPRGLKISFDADKYEIQSGESVKLEWKVKGDNFFGVDLNGQPVAPSGHQEVWPPETTSYMLGVDTGETIEQREIFIIVDGQGQPMQPLQPQQPQQPPQPPQPNPPGGGNQPGSPVTGVVAHAIPSSYTGPSGVTLNFNADITVNGPCTVTYQWERSDGATGQVETVVFNSAGTRQIATLWTLGGGPGAGTIWQRVNILTPVPMTSNQAIVNLNFTP